MKFVSLLLLGCFLLPFKPETWGQALDRTDRNSVPGSIVVLDVTRKQYDYLQPWARRMKSVQKVGLVVGDNQVLTTADELFDRTLIRMQKNGRGKWWIGSLRWIDYHANLAMVEATEPGFTRDLPPVKWAEPTAVEGPLMIARWREGHIEVRNAEINQVRVDTGHLTFAPYVQFEISSEIQGVGWGEPVLTPSGVLGLVTAQNGNNCTITPASFIQPILQAHREGTYRGLGYFDFYWQPAENPANLDYLKLEGEPRGVLISEVPSIHGTSAFLKPRDIILQVDGHDIDVQGDYLDPDYGHLSLENLATRGKWAGDEVKLLVWRNGEAKEVVYRLPKADYASTLVPDAAYDQEPEYLIVGGLVFQPLNDPFLQSWGADWKRRAPFRLNYYNNEEPTKERPSLVILSQVLPDVYNVGYQEIKYLVVDEVNGRKISRLTDLQEALQHPVEGFHHVQFMQSDTLRRLVLSAEDRVAATARVLKRYGIPAESYIAPALPHASASAVAITH